MGPQRPFVVYNLREVYHEDGEYEFKLVLDRRKFKNSHSLRLSVHDSDGREVPSRVERWGTKMRCKFEIGPGASEGVAHGRLSGPDGREEGRFFFWIVK